MIEAEFRLRVCTGADAGKELLVTDAAAGPVTIGRTVDGPRDLLCSDDKVSRRHATITWTDGGYVLTDLHSTNRTRVNGALVRPEAPVPVSDGDEILLGPDTRVRFEFLRSERVRAAVEPRAPRSEFGPYAVYEVLSRGPIDRVDVALDTRNGTRVALKRFATLELSRTARKRILEQAERGQHWQHPNIAEVLDAGSIGEVLYVASRLVDGVTVAAILDRCAPEVDVALATYVARESCAALQSAVEQVPTFVHRNLCPGTIMLSNTGDVALIDFGFAPLDALQVGTGRLSREKSRYLAPEHRAQRGLDARSDVFSLGVVLYELLVHGPADQRQLAGLATGDIPGVPADLLAVVRRATAVRPEARFPGAGDMEAALRAALYAMAPGYGQPEVTAWLIKRRLGSWQ